MKTQVAIVGGGPAGLLLGHLLRAEGIDCLIVERQTRAHVESRIRAGVLEAGTTDLLRRIGIDTRLNAEGMIENGLNLGTPDGLIRIDIKALTGKHATVYGQTEVTRDLIEAALCATQTAIAENYFVLPCEQGCRDNPCSCAP